MGNPEQAGCMEHRPPCCETVRMFVTTPCGARLCMAVPTRRRAGWLARRLARLLRLARPPALTVRTPGTSPLAFLLPDEPLTVLRADDELKLTTFPERWNLEECDEDDTDALCEARDERVSTPGQAARLAGSDVTSLDSIPAPAVPTDHDATLESPRAASVGPGLGPGPAIPASPDAALALSKHRALRLLEELRLPSMEGESIEMESEPRRKRRRVRRRPRRGPGQGAGPGQGQGAGPGQGQGAGPGQEQGAGAATPTDTRLGDPALTEPSEPNFTEPSPSEPYLAEPSPEPPAPILRPAPRLVRSLVA